MVLEVAILDIRAGHSERFETAFEKAKDILAAAKGYQRHELHKSADRDDRYLLLVWWDSVESNKVGFRNSPAYQEWKKSLNRFYDPFPQFEHYAPLPKTGVPKDHDVGSVSFRFSGSPEEGEL